MGQLMLVYWPYIILSSVSALFFVLLNGISIWLTATLINNILLDIENKLYLDPTDMHDLHMLIVYKKPEIKTFYIVLNEAEWLDHWDRLINALIRIEKNITEDDYTYYNTFVSIREEITNLRF